MKILLRTLYVMLLSGVLFGCKKFLDEKPDAKLSTLSTVTDIQSYLDHYITFNENKYPQYLEIGSDSYYLTDTHWEGLFTENERNAYAWNKTEDFGDWQDGYNVIFNCNTALDELGKINDANFQAGFGNVKGSALFFRGFYYHALSQIYTPVYDAATAAKDLGLPLRTDPDYRIPSVRSTVQQTYDLILSDLKEAASMLPVTPIVKTRPSKPAAFAMIARTYLTMREYDSAGVYADKCLKLYSYLLNFNGLTASATAPITRLNDEIIFYASSRVTDPINSSRAKINPALYAKYEANDLRKVIYFRENTGANTGTFAFKGDYHRSATGTTFTGYLFGGIILDEVYLIRAECFARTGNTGLALNDLNTLLQTRWKAGTFTPISATSPNEAVGKILEERDKELLFRGVRWMDMRRLSKDPQFAKTFIRTVKGIQYELAPGSLRYTYQIPGDVISKTGIQQNP